MLWPYRSLGTPQHPALVFLHGFLGAGSDWLTVATRFADRFFCIMPDLPGHGKNTTRSLDQPLDFDLLTQALLETLDALQVNKANLAGYSMGGRLALHAAAKFPERIRSLVLESCHPGIAVGERLHRAASDRRRAEILLTGGIDVFVEQWYESDLFQTLKTQARMFASLKEKRKRNDASWMAKIIEELSPSRQVSLWKALETLPFPVLLIAGALDEKYVGITKRMQSKIPDAKMNIITGAGHNVHLEAPGAFSESLLGFLRESVDFPLR